jgi:hypothetical protein
MDKMNELFFGALALIGGLGGFVTKRIFTNTDTLSDRLSLLEQSVAKKSDLKSIEKNVEIILTHILSKK